MIYKKSSTLALFVTVMVLLCLNRLPAQAPASKPAAAAPVQGGTTLNRTSVPDCTGYVTDFAGHAGICFSAWSSNPIATRNPLCIWPPCFVALVVAPFWGRFRYSDFRSATSDGRDSEA
jgi:hypothetical protein